MKASLKRHIACLLFALMLASCATAVATKSQTPPPIGVIGKISNHMLVNGESMYDVARKYHLGIKELAYANPHAKTRFPAPGTILMVGAHYVLPDAPRDGIVINLAELRLYFFGKSGEILTFPVSIGKEGWETPLAVTEIIRKRRNPTWTPPPSIRKENPDLPKEIPAGPSNPLGEYALDLAIPGILVHGTNRPKSIGQQISHGCIRLYPENIATLFEASEVGTPVYIINQPFKVGIFDGRIFIEVHPPLDSHEEELSSPAIAKNRVTALSKLVSFPVNWEIFDRAMQEKSGLPVMITP